MLTPEFDVEVGELDGSPGSRVDRLARARAAGTATPLIDLAVLALRIHNRQIRS